MNRFTNLCQDEQLDLLYAEGVYIGKRREEDLMYVLFQLDHFYVEIVYWQYRKLIYSMNSFCDTIYLDPYLEQVEIAIN